MRLISLYIKQFGCLANFKMIFDKNLTIKFADNGKGKSTLAAFIKAMFYGLENATKKDKFVDRKHFAPLNGDSFGGSIIFECKGQTYRIERFFDNKSSSKDITCLYDQNNHRMYLKEEYGDYFFGIDKESYERTAFIGSEDLLTKSTLSINKKLNNLVSNVKDDYDFDTIIEKLDDGIKKYYYPQGKVNKGEYEKCQDKIDELKEKIAQLAAIEATMEQNYEKLSDYDKSIDKLKSDILLAQKEDITKKDWEHYDSLIEEVNNLKSDLQKELDKYQNGLPTKEELKSLEDNLDIYNATSNRLESVSYNDEDKIRHETLKSKYQIVPSLEDINYLEKNRQKEQELKIKLDSLTFSNEKETKLNILKEKFDSKVINDEIILKIDDQVSMLEKHKIINESTSNQFNDDEIRKLKRMFDDNLPSKEKILEIESLLRDYQLNKEKLDGISYQNKHNTPIILNATISMLLLIATIILFVFQMHIYVYITLGLTVLSFISLLVVFITSKNKSNKNEWKYKEKNIEIANMLREFFASFMISGDEFSTNLLVLKNDIDKYQKYLEIKNKVMDDKKVEDIKESLSKTFSTFNYTGKDYKTMLDQLKNDYKDYVSLNEDYKELEIARKNISFELENNEKGIKNVLQKYNIYINNVNELNDILLEINDLVKLNDSFIALVTRNKEDKEKCDKSKVYIDDFKSKYQVTIDIKKYSNDARNSITIIESLKDSIKDKVQKIEKFKNDNNLSLRPDSNKKSVDELNELLSKTVAERDSLKAIISDNEDKLMYLSEYEENILAYQEEKQKAKARADQITKAKMFMESADENLKNKFIMPIQNKYIEYARQINPQLADNISMNYDFEINFDINGKYKNYLQLSLGEKACLGLCLRFAIIDNIYKDDKPIIILDDPFVNLDEDNLQKAKDVLVKLSSNTQVLYLCCHKSRMIEK